MSELRGIRFALLLVALICAGGLALIPVARSELVFVPSVFFLQYATFEPPALLAALAFLGAFWLMGRRIEGAAILSRAEAVVDRPRLAVWLLAGLTLILSGAGLHAIYHNFALSLDEHAANWQAQALLRGSYFGRMPRELLPYAAATQCFFRPVSGSEDLVVNVYLPGFAAMRALMMALRVPWLLNPLLASASVLLVALVARRIWPRDPSAAAIAALLLATSAQFQINAMSGFSMPAHLCLNLLWLWLYLRADQDGDRKCLAVLPLVGLFALMLHKPFHALFVAPFLFRILRNWRWRATLYVGIFYLAGYLLYRWHYSLMESSYEAEIFRVLSPAGKPAFGLAGALLWVELITWQNLAAVALAIAVLWRWREVPTVVRDLAFGLALTCALVFIREGGQGHGWGNRYAHMVLGNLCLMAACAWHILRGESAGLRGAPALVAAATALAIAVQIPLRCWQVEGFVRPFKAGCDCVRSQDADFAVVDAADIWYGADLLRNPPFLDQRPVVLSVEGLAPEKIERLRQLGDVKVVPTEELTALGLRRAADVRRLGQR